MCVRNRFNDKLAKIAAFQPFFDRRKKSFFDAIPPSDIVKEAHSNGIGYRQNGSGKEVCHGQS
jgi:hypothetical protein